MQQLSIIDSYQSLKPSLYTYYTQRSIWIPDTENIRLYDLCWSKCRHRHHKKEPSIKSSSPPPQPSSSSSSSSTATCPTTRTHSRLKPHLCYNWLSGCYRGDQCHFAHSIDDMVMPYYASVVISHYALYTNLTIDETQHLYVCKEITDCHCGNPTTKCSLGSRKMHVRSDLPLKLPYCVVNCKACSFVKTIPIYIFK